MIDHRVILDQRVSGREKWTLLPKGVNRLMQVPDEMRKSVVFLYFNKEGQARPAGTAFIAALKLPDFAEHGVNVLLTAQHVIAGIRRVSDDQQVLIRFNTTQGDAGWVTSSVDEWDHLDPHVDCALLKWAPGPEQNADHAGWLLEAAATSDEMAAQGLGLGDEVFMVGLFRNHLGRDRNEPILRVGNIAAIPADPIYSREFGEMRALLIEARSIGGLSGSPVWIHMGYSRHRDGQILQYQGDRPFVFLGLIHGHWDALDSEVDAAPDESLSDIVGEKLNMGIGLVVPVDSFLSLVLEATEELVNAVNERMKADNAPTQDSLESEPETEFDRFEDLARNLVNTPKPETDDD